MAHTVSHHRLPETPVSPRREQHSPSRPNGRPASRSGAQQSPKRPSSGKAPVFDHPDIRLQGAPASPVSISPPRQGIQEPGQAYIRGFPGMGERRRSEREYATPDSEHTRDSVGSLPIRSRTPSGQVKMMDGNAAGAHSRASSASGPLRIDEFGAPAPPEHAQDEQSSGLVYSAFDDAPPKKRHVQNRASQMTVGSTGSGSSGERSDPRQSRLLAPGGAGMPRPTSMFTLGSELRGRTLSPMSANGSDPGSPRLLGRDASGTRRSPAARPLSYIDLLSNVPYNQQVAPGPPMNNAPLQSVVGSGASLLNTKKTLEMYRANVKKTNDASVQYEFAIFMVNTAKDILPEDESALVPGELVQEAKGILQRLSDRAYPFAQYYLADGYFSGLFNKDKPDYDKAFPLFVAASKHGHAEAGYRAALCYQYAWGTSKNYAKAVQFYRAAASKGHPGAATRLGLACLAGDMGLGKSKDTYREGCRWLKRGQENADFQYNAAPYELGLLHLTGYGDDIFKDEGYAAQLLTQAAELGHVQANFLMGQAYETGRYGCPRDAALSVHFYNGAATKGAPEAMMALCAWYMVGAEPVLEKDEQEAYAWARQAADTGFAKAEYAVAYFTEMGIGCRRDPLEANVMYVRAADSGSAQAKQRLDIIREAAAGHDPGIPMSKAEAKVHELRPKRSKRFGIF